MKLTGKCKEEFDKWIITEMYYLGTEPLSDLFMNALIIDFFDSVGIYINIKSYQYLYDWSYEIKQLKRKTIVMEDDPKQAIKTRIQATNYAITKANEIFNLNNK